MYRVCNYMQLVTPTHSLTIYRNGRHHQNAPTSPDHVDGAMLARSAGTRAGLTGCPQATLTLRDSKNTSYASQRAGSWYVNPFAGYSAHGARGQPVHCRSPRPRGFRLRSRLGLCRKLTSSRANSSAVGFTYDTPKDVTSRLRPPTLMSAPGRSA